MLCVRVSTLYSLDDVLVSVCVLLNTISSFSPWPTDANLVLFDLLGLAVAAALTLVVGEVAVLAVRHGLHSPTGKTQDMTCI